MSPAPLKSDAKKVKLPRVSATKQQVRTLNSLLKTSNRSKAAPLKGRRASTHDFMAPILVF
jgi:hypothetical protein